MPPPFYPPHRASEHTSPPRSSLPPKLSSRPPTPPPSPSPAPMLPHAALPPSFFRTTLARRESGDARTSCTPPIRPRSDRDRRRRSTICSRRGSLQHRRRLCSSRSSSTARPTTATFTYTSCARLRHPRSSRRRRRRSTICSRRGEPTQPPTLLPFTQHIRAHAATETYIIINTSAAAFANVNVALTGASSSPLMTPPPSPSPA